MLGAEIDRCDVVYGVTTEHISKRCEPQPNFSSVKGGDLFSFFHRFRSSIRLCLRTPVERTAVGRVAIDPWGPPQEAAAVVGTTPCGAPRKRLTHQTPVLI